MFLLIFLYALYNETLALFITNGWTKASGRARVFRFLTNIVKTLEISSMAQLSDKNIALDGSDKRLVNS